MPQKQLTKYKVAIVKLIQFIFGDGKLALALCLVQILTGTHLEYGVTGLVGARDKEANRLQSTLKLVAGGETLTEVGVRLAIQIGYGGLPLALEFSKQGRWDGD